MTDSLSQIFEDLKNFKELKIAQTAIQPVFGEGDPHAEIMFIGEAPGAEEDKQGKPFVGRAGKLLNQLLENVGMKREAVYITNIVKFRPPENRDPTDEEKAAMVPFLIRQIQVIKPLVIATLGRHSMGYFLPNVKISEVHGQAKRTKGYWNEHQIYFPLYHPAVALYNPNQKTTLQHDLAKLPLLLKKIKEDHIYGL